MDTSEEEYYIEERGKKKKERCQCVVLASHGACVPDNDIKSPKLGQLWIRDTDLMYVYMRERLNVKEYPRSSKNRSCYENTWKKVPSTKRLTFNFVSQGEFGPVPYVETFGTINTVVRTFVFPDSFSGLGGRIRRIDYSNSWSQEVSSPDLPSDQGMIIIIRDISDRESVAIAQDRPSTFEQFSSSENILYQPNPGDILEIIIAKPLNESQEGEARLHSLSLVLAPFFIPPDCS